MQYVRVSKAAVYWAQMLSKVLLAHRRSPRITSPSKRIVSLFSRSWSDPVEKAFRVNETITHTAHALSCWKTRVSFRQAYRMIRARANVRLLPFAISSMTSCGGGDRKFRPTEGVVSAPMIVTMFACRILVTVLLNPGKKRKNNWNWEWDVASNLLRPWVLDPGVS
jgi:hypothetical protein